MFNSFRAPQIKKQKLLALKYLRVLTEYLRRLTEYLRRLTHAQDQPLAGCTALIPLKHSCFCFFVGVNLRR